MMLKIYLQTPKVTHKSGCISLIDKHPTTFFYLSHTSMMRDFLHTKIARFMPANLFYSERRLVLLILALRTRTVQTKLKAMIQ